MDLFSFFAMFYDFFILLIPLTIIVFVGSRLLSKLREKIEDKFKLGWMKSIFITNFIVIFVIIFLAFIYFILVGMATAQFRTPEIEYDLMENLALVGLGAVRVAITALILSLFLLFFELIDSLAVELLDKKEWSDFVKEFVAVLIVCAIFLILFLFLFSWATFGLFIYVFYGGVSSGPLLMVL